MAFTEEISTNYLVNGATGELEIQTWTTTLRDGKVLSREKFTEVLAPGTDVDKQSPTVQALATAAWTPDKVTAWDDQFVAQMAESRVMRETMLAEAEAKHADALERVTRADAAAAAAVVKERASVAKAAAQANAEQARKTNGN